MTGLQTLAARLALGTAAGTAGVVLSCLRAIHQPGKSAFRRIMMGAFLLSRLGTFAIVFLLFRVAPRGDIPSFYFPEAGAVLRGLLPYRDFGSSYAPLHPFLDAGILLLWHSPLALILFAICVESVLFFLWLRLGRDLFSERELRIAAVLYLASAMSIQFVAIDGQDNVLIALLVLVAVWLAMRSRPLLSGAITGLGVVLVKLIPVFFAPVFFAAGKRRWGWAAGFGAVVAAGYGSFWALRLPILQPLSIEGPLKSAGTVPFLIETLTGVDLPVGVWDVVMLLCLSLLYVAVFRQSSGGSTLAQASMVIWGISAATLVLLTFANKSWSPYLLLCLFPLCVAVAGRGLGARIAFAAFGIVALVEKSYWATLLDLDGAREVRSAVLRHDPKYIAFLPIQVLLLLGYGWLLRLCLDRLLDRPVDRLRSMPTGSEAVAEARPSPSGASFLDSGKGPR